MVLQMLTHAMLKQGVGKLFANVDDSMLKRGVGPNVWESKVRRF